MITNIKDFISERKKLNEEVQAQDVQNGGSQSLAQDLDEDEEAFNRMSDMINDMSKDQAQDVLTKLLASINDMDAQDDTQDAQAQVQAQPVQVQEVQPAQDVQAQIQTQDELQEGFFGDVANKVKNALPGAKTINLDTYNASKDATNFVATRKDLMKNYYAYFCKDNIMDQATADKAVMALYDIANGIPLLNKFAFSYDAENNTLNINPNKDGVLKALVSGATGNAVVA